MSEPVPEIVGKTDDELELYDQSRRAEKVLDYVLHEELSQSDETTQNAAVDVAAARADAPVVVQDSGRASSRVLFVTDSSAVLTTGSTEQNEYVARSRFFDEVHVMVLLSRNGKQTSVRVGDRTWVYTVYAPQWWKLPFAARAAAREFLTFNESVRPDIIVATNPYEIGLAGRFIARAFNRPLQVHVSEDFTTPEFRKADTKNAWRFHIARYVLKRTASVRTTTDVLKAMIARRFKRVSDLEVLPRFYNFTGYLNAVPAFDIHDKYRDFVFIALAFGPLTADSYLHDTFAALNRTLHNPRIGLVVVGAGPAEALFREKVKLLEIEQSVVFVKTLEDPVSVIKSADALISTGTTHESEEYAMRAAAAGTPLVAIETALLTDLFADGESAFLCPPGDILCMSQKFTKLLNSPALRKQFARNGQQITRDRLIEDPDAYYRSYRDSIEVVLAGEAPVSVAEQQQSAAAAQAPAVPAAQA